MSNFKNDLKELRNRNTVPSSSSNRSPLEINENTEDELANLYTVDELRNYGRVLHRRQPKDLFNKQPIPWRTILLCLVFFILGSLFLFLGIFKWTKTSLSESYEYLLLGLIMFIPGSYHTVILIQILRGVDGYSYDMIDMLDQD